MEELLFGAVIMWALGKIAKKKADAPAPGTIAPPTQGTTQQFPTTSGGSQGAAFNPNDRTSGQPGGGRPGQL